MFPFGQLVQNPQQVNAGEHVSPAEGGCVANLQGLRGEFRLFTDHARGEVEESNANEGKTNKLYLVTLVKVLIF
jgi:hypothetical protein